MQLLHFKRVRQAPPTARTPSSRIRALETRIHHSTGRAREVQVPTPGEGRPGHLPCPTPRGGKRGVDPSLTPSVGTPRPSASGPLFAPSGAPATQVTNLTSVLSLLCWKAILDTLRPREEHTSAAR